MNNRLNDLYKHYEEIMSELNTDIASRDVDRYKKLMKEQVDLEPIVSAYKEYLNAENTGRGEQFINDSKKGRIFKEDINSLIKNTINVDTSNGKKKGLFGK